MIPVLFGLTIIIFIIVRLHGDPVLQFVRPDASPAEIELIRKAYGFDRPLWEQYFTFITKAVQGDFGDSFRYRQPALPLVLERVPVTLALTVISLLIAIAVALPTGIISALRQNSAIDLMATGVSVVGRAMPNYWLGILLILVVGVQLQWLPVSGTESVSGVGDWRYWVLPSLTLGMSVATTFTRLIRSSMLEVIRMDYIVTARGKGASESRVVWFHALRNALLSVITVFGLQTGFLLGGAVIVEQVFALPGMGRLMLQAVYTRDMAIVQAGVFVSALIIMGLNLLVDTLYTVLDPRIRY
jgi:peptide/nickel transport system permease protein